MLGVLQAQAQIDSGAIPTFVNIVVPNYLNTAGVRGGSPNQPIKECLFRTSSYYLPPDERNGHVYIIGADSSVLPSPLTNAVICHCERLFYKLLAPAITPTTSEYLVPSQLNLKWKQLGFRREAALFYGKDCSYDVAVAGKVYKLKLSHRDSGRSCPSCTQAALLYYAYKSGTATPQFTCILARVTVRAPYHAKPPPKH